MKKFILFSLGVLFLTACAGNPPSWWNPNNRYGATSANSAKASAAAATSRRTVVVEEEEMDPLPDASYEEETLSPLPELEEIPAGELSGAELVQTDENLLPVPSVLD